MPIPVPQKLFEKLQDFATRRVTGQITLDFRDGRILGIKFTENCRLECDVKERRN